jgi:hypothetical protein
MKKDDRPDVLFDKLTTIKNWYNAPTKKIPESQLVAVLARAPKYYKSLLAFELRANVKACIEKVDKLQQTLVQHYRTIFGSRPS